MTVARLILAAGLILLPAAAQHETPAAEPRNPVEGVQQKAEQAGAEAARGIPNEPAGAKKGAAHHSMEGWKWANFIVLAAGLGYLIGRNAGPYFSARSQQIRKDIHEAEQLRKEADVRVAEVERKLAALGAEIEALRREAQQEQAVETARIERQIASELEKIERHAAQEIDSAEKHARNELKRYAAQLAVETAERKIRAGMTPQTEDALVESFVADLGRRAS